MLSQLSARLVGQPEASLPLSSPAAASASLSTKNSVAAVKAPIPAKTAVPSSSPAVAAAAVISQPHKPVLATSAQATSQLKPALDQAMTAAAVTSSISSVKNQLPASGHEGARAAEQTENGCVCVRVCACVWVEMCLFIFYYYTYCVVIMLPIRCFRLFGSNCVQMEQRPSTTTMSVLLLQYLATASSLCSQRLTSAPVCFLPVSNDCVGLLASKDCVSLLACLKRTAARHYLRTVYHCISLSCQCLTTWSVS